MPSLDRMVLAEYSNEKSDFKKAAIAVDKVYDGLMNGFYSVVLADCEIETTLRKLHQRIMELKNAVVRANNNEKKLIKEIDKLRIDVTALKNSLIEFLLMLRGRIGNFSGIYERTCKEYGLKLQIAESDRGILRWDHLRPDPSTVLGSLQFIEDYHNELENSKHQYSIDLNKICSELHSLGMKNIPEAISAKTDFQELRYKIDLILGAIDINGLCDLTRSVSRFFNLASELAETFPDSNVEIELDAAEAELELIDFKIKYTKKGKFVYPNLLDIMPLATLASDETRSISTNVYEITAGFENLQGLVCNLKRLKLCVPSARSFMVILSKHENVKKTDYSENYSRFAASIPTSIEQIPNYVATAGVFKNITKAIEFGIRT